jgi:hypothetical protein
VPSDEPVVIAVAPTRQPIARCAGYNGDRKLVMARASIPGASKMVGCLSNRTASCVRDAHSATDALNVALPSNRSERTGSGSSLRVKGHVHQSGVVSRTFGVLHLLLCMYGPKAAAGHRSPSVLQRVLYWHESQRETNPLSRD